MAAELLGEGLKAFQKTATALITMYQMYLLIARFALNYSESNTLKLLCLMSIETFLARNTNIKHLSHRSVKVKVKIH